MQNKTVKELKSLAKDLGLRGYSQLRKAELIQMRRNSSNILDEPVPEINVPILEPVQFIAKKYSSIIEKFQNQLSKI